MIAVLRALLSPFNVIALIVLALVYGADKVVKRPPVVAAPPEVRQTLKQAKVSVYYVTPDMSAYFTQPREVDVQDNLPQEVGQASVRAWVAGPQGASGKALAVVPADSDVPRVWARGEHYYVDLPQSYTNLNYGATGERMLLCSLTQTLLAVRGQDVRFLVNGQDATTLLGHMDLRSPYTKADCDL